MPDITNEIDDDENLLLEIRAAFPDEVFLGSITPVDGQPNEELDEEQALYSTLYGRKWSEISELFVEQNPDGFLLLTEEAFGAFLARWLICALNNADVREMLVYSFSPDSASSAHMDGRIHQLSIPQRKALRAFLARCLELESSGYIEESARNALAYIKGFPGTG